MLVRTATFTVLAIAALAFACLYLNLRWMFAAVIHVSAFIVLGGIAILYFVRHTSGKLPRD